MQTLDIAPLFVPGHRPELVEKALKVTGSVILDLEDAVPPALKTEARTNAAALAGQGLPGLIVRINARSTPWHEEDVAALAASRPTLMAPKVSGPEDLRALSAFAVIALCETARGVLAASAIAETENCVALFWGGEDLAADCGGRTSRDSGHRYYPPAQLARASVLLAATAAGKPAVDAVYVNHVDLTGLEAEAIEAADMGFAAKACIHPNQVARVRAGFEPSEQELDEALEIIELAEASPGVFDLRGRMIDAPLVAQARVVVRRHSHATAER